MKELLNFLNHHTQAEHHYVVTRLDQRIAGYQYSLSITDHTSDGSSFREP